MTYKAKEIEKGVPLTGRRKYPFDNMQVMDSVFIETNGDKSAIRTICSILNSYKKRSHMNFTARTVEGGIRVWRIA